MNRIDGKKLAAEIRTRVKQAIADEHRSPGFGVILVGDDKASHLYVQMKEKACTDVGIRFEKVLLPKHATEEAVIAAIHAFNARPDIDAMLVQFPLPAHLNEDAVVRAIDPTKDVDGFHPDNIHRVENNTATILPVLVQAIIRLLEATGESLGGKQVVLFANSTVLSVPLTAALAWRGMESTTILGKHLADPAKQIGQADIVIVAVGKPKFLRAKDAKDGAIIIDVGTNALPDGTSTGDVDGAGIETKPGWISPVPGGVGPVTVAQITENILALHRLHRP